MDWSIQEVARLSGATSRTLRHYEDAGLLSSKRGANGYRRYDEDALVTLQRILLLRGLGLGLPAIAEVLAGQRDDVQALHGHLRWLEEEKARIDRQISSVETTILTMEGGGQLMVNDMFDGFDHTQHKAEVEERWGTDAYARSDAWWRSMSAEEQKAWQAQVAQLSGDWFAAAGRGVDPAGAEAQELAARHVAWLASVPGRPDALKDYVIGLADLYVTDERFAKNYGGVVGAGFVRDALVAYAGRAL